MSDDKITVLPVKPKAAEEMSALNYQFNEKQ